MSITFDEKANNQKRKMSLITQSVIQMGILLVLSIIGLFIILIILFIIIRSIPGSIYTDIGGYLTPEEYDALVNLWGLNKPAISQFFIFLWNLISGNLGESFLIARGYPVNDLVVTAYSRSLEINFLSFGFSLLLGVIFGVLAFIFKDKWSGLIPQAIKRLNWAIPAIGLAFLLQFLFAFKNQLLPAGSYYDFMLDPIPDVTHFRLIDCLLAEKPDYFWDTIRHLILPVICIGFITFTFITDLTYSIIDFFKSPKEMHYLFGKIGFYLSFILCSNLLIEIIFNLHGIGRLAIYGMYGETFILSAALYRILLTFFIINLSINFLLHLIRIIKELVNKTNLDEDIFEPTVVSTASAEMNLEPTMDTSVFKIDTNDDTNDENKKSVGKEIFMNLRRKLFNPLTILGILTILFVLILAIFAKRISPYDYEIVSGFDMTVLPFDSPSSENTFGTTKFGRDVFSRCLYGIQTAVKVGIISTLIGMPLGVLMGTISAFFGKWVKFIIDTINGMILFFPGIIFTFMIIAILGSEFSNFYWILGLVNLPIATLFTQQAVSYEMKKGDINTFKFGPKQNGKKKLIKLPNIILSILGVGCFITGFVILMFEAVSFMGFGDPTIITLGVDINLAQRHIEYAPWATLWPAFCLYITVLGFIMLGIGLKEE